VKTGTVGTVVGSQVGIVGT
jgi:hypothetical protein